MTMWNVFFFFFFFGADVEDEEGNDRQLKDFKEFQVHQVISRPFYLYLNISISRKTFLPSLERKKKFQHKKKRERKERVPDVHFQTLYETYDDIPFYYILRQKKTCVLPPSRPDGVFPCGHFWTSLNLTPATASGFVCLALARAAHHLVGARRVVLATLRTRSNYRWQPKHMDAFTLCSFLGKKARRITRM